MSNYILLLDIASVYFFGMTGALTAMSYKKLDAYGVALVSLLTAVGGGTVRDVLLDAHPIAWISHNGYIVAIIAGYFTAFIVRKWLAQFKRPFLVLDAVAVAFAALAGFERSIAFYASPVAAVFLGVVTATFGGMLRDVLCHEVPKILRTELYATVIIIGCAIKCGIYVIEPKWIALGNITAYSFIIFFRIYTVHKNWSMVLLENKIQRVWRRMVRGTKKLKLN